MFNLGKKPLVKLSAIDSKQRLKRRKFETIYLLGIYFLFTTTTAISQVGIGITTPDNSAMLQVQSVDKGFLLPQMTSAQRTSIASPASGLQVYDTNTKSIWYFNGTFWVNTQAMATEGDIKSGIQVADHSGWVLLDGRSLSTLSTNQQAVAASLGLSGNLPNASDAYLVQNGGGMGTVSGSNTTTLTQANLPNVSFTGTAASAGDHNHSVDPAAVTSSTNGNHTHGSNAGGGAGGLGLVYSDGNATAGSTDYTWGELNLWTVPYALSIYANGNHNHTVDIPATTSTTTGAHMHSVSVASGGTASPIDISPKSLSVNMFVYLGL